MSSRVRIVTVCQGGRGGQSVAENRDRIMGLADLALREAARPDLICLPEAFISEGLGRLPLEQKVEPIDGPTVQAAGRRAKAGRCYVICPIKVRRGEDIFNSAVVLDRAGQVAGVYDKLCPVTSSPDYTVMEGGVTPGSDLPVFDLDFGRVGIQICFDAGFPENWQILADKGARLVFWCSAYDGGFSLRTYAYLHHYYVVSSVRRGRSRIIDPLGTIRAETDEASPLAWRDINLDYVVAHGDFNKAVAEEIGRAYGDRVAVYDSAPGSAHFVVEPVDPAVTAERLCSEFGFESTFQYHQRHRQAYEHLRAGQPAPPQSAAHSDRPQYEKPAKRADAAAKTGALG